MNDTDRTPFIFEIREEKYEELAARFAKMVGRARKCKTTAPVFSVIHEADEKQVRQTDMRETASGSRSRTWVRYLYVTVEGERPAVDGWNFIATIDHTEAYTDEAGNVIGNLMKACPGPARSRSATGQRSRSATTARAFAGGMRPTSSARATSPMQIGKNCLADFLPGSSPADLAQQLAWWTEATEILSGGGDEEGSGRPGESRFGLESLLQATQATIEAFGWVSRTKARDSQDQATADRPGRPLHEGVRHVQEGQGGRREDPGALRRREEHAR